MRDRPLIQKLFFALIVISITVVPFLLIVAGDDVYEGLEIRGAKLESTPAEARLAIVLDNDGDRRVRITDVAPLRPGSTDMRVGGVDARYNPRGQNRAGLRKFSDFEIAPQQRRFVEIFRTIGDCDGGAATVRDVRVTFEVFGGSQERVLGLPEPVELPACA